MGILSFFDPSTPRREARREAYHEGIRAGQNGSEIWENPHCKPDSSVIRFEGWNAGWMRGKQLGTMVLQSVIQRVEAEKKDKENG